MKHVSGLFMFGIPVSLILVRKENGKQKDVKWNLLFVLFYQVLRGWQFDFEGWEGGGWWGLEEWFAYKYFWQVSLSPYTCLLSFSIHTGFEACKHFFVFYTQILQIHFNKFFYPTLPVSSPQYQILHLLPPPLSSTRFRPFSCHSRLESLLDLHV